MSETSTAPAVIHNNPRVHQRKNRANTPCILPPNSRVITTQVSAEEATVRATDWYETLWDKSVVTRVRTMALSKRNFTTISKQAHVPGRQIILDIKTPSVESRESTQPQPVLIEDTQNVTS